jgi:hypothetical protein
MKNVPLNPRYVNYCRIQGNTIEEQKEKDLVAMPGGVMIPFIFFIQKHIDLFRVMNPNAFCCGNLSKHDLFDAYLDSLPIENKC